MRLSVNKPTQQTLLALIFCYNHCLHAQDNIPIGNVKSREKCHLVKIIGMNLECYRRELLILSICYGIVAILIIL